jgi:hypothetical protein
MDLHSTVSYDDSEDDKQRESPRGERGGGYGQRAGGQEERPTGQEARARYGGQIPDPEGISPDATIEISLNNDATLREVRITGLKDPESISVGRKDPDKISVWTGVRDDPFIFPPFFGTNVVAMVVSIPLTRFPENQQGWLVWATSHKGGRQIDHVGRSLRTQNPRFELLNTRPPREHAHAVREENKNPSLKRDLALRFGFQPLFAYRPWDFVPDVMIYARRFPVGFPNGRYLTDDVAALLGQHGDTQLLELSHHTPGRWPRMTTNDKEFLKQFPYLAEPHPDSEERLPPSLTAASRLKLAGIAIAVLLLLTLMNWLFARWYHRKKLRRRYL